MRRRIFVAEMEGPSRVLSRSGKDLGSFANLEEDEVDMLLDDSYAEVSSVADLLQECPSVTPLDAGGSSRDRSVGVLVCFCF